MAISNNTVLEVRPSTGSDNNGGGYVSGGTDYSQQANPILAITDLTSVLASTTISSVIGGLTTGYLDCGAVQRVEPTLIPSKEFSYGYII